jgi:hypothetical protein
MNRVTRRLLTFVSIVGGGLLGATPVAAVAPSDPTPPPPAPPAAASETPAIPVPVPVPEPVVRTGRAPAPGGSTGVSPAGPVDGPSVSVRTGRATDLVPPVNSSTAPPSPPGSPTSPSSPAPAPPTAPHSRVPAPIPATTDGAASGASKPPAVSVAAGPPPPDPTSHAAVAGDDLWSIAAAQLAQVTGHPVASLSSSDVAAYWQRVCDANRSRLQSGDINLIFPGEQIVLPPVSE